MLQFPVQGLSMIILWPPVPTVDTEKNYSWICLCACVSLYECMCMCVFRCVPSMFVETRTKFQISSFYLPLFILLRNSLPPNLGFRFSSLSWKPQQLISPASNLPQNSGCRCVLDVTNELSLQSSLKTFLYHVINNSNPYWKGFLLLRCSQGHIIFPQGWFCWPFSLSQS